MTKGKGGVGRRCVGSNHKAKKYNKQILRADFLARHVDQVWEDVRKPAHEVHDGKSGPRGTTAKAELDEDVPGFGRHYCLSCSRYFQTVTALADHQKTRPHKRKLKMLLTSARPHAQRDADAAAGMGAPDNGPRLRSATAAAAVAPGGMEVDAAGGL